MADRRDEDRRFRGERRDPETERRIERQADRYRGSDERGYGGGERLGRDWERGELRGPERLGRGVRSVDEERLSQGHVERGLREAPRERGERRFRDPGRDADARRYAEPDRDRPVRDARELGRGDWRDSPSGAFHDEERRHHAHYSLAGLHDLDDLSELRERYQERRRERDYEPRYGHGPGIENMESPRLGYGTSTTRRTSEDHELGHGGMLGTWRAGEPRSLGRGPKGYQRSDDRIREDICDRLMMSWMNAENVDVLVREGEVTLQGTVTSRDEKRAIEAVAESVLGVRDITNALRIDRGEQPQERRAQDSEQPPAQKPGDPSLHS
jgi:hypothetical protein